MVKKKSGSYYIIRRLCNYIGLVTSRCGQSRSCKGTARKRLEIKGVSMSDDKFGRLRLSVQGTNNGRGFDIFYDFGKSLNFVEFESKREFYFIQPWMQFPSQEYTDQCTRVSIELVRRFNAFEALEQRIKSLETERDYLRQQRIEVVLSRKEIMMVLTIINPSTSNSTNYPAVYELREKLRARLKEVTK